MSWFRLQKALGVLFIGQSCVNRNLTNLLLERKSVGNSRTMLSACLGLTLKPFRPRIKGLVAGTTNTCGKVRCMQARPLPR